MCPWNSSTGVGHVQLGLVSVQDECRAEHPAGNVLAVEVLLKFTWFPVELWEMLALPPHPPTWQSKGAPLLHEMPSTSLFPPG